MNTFSPIERGGYRAGVHRAAVLLAVAVLPLILVGAGVTSKQAGMAFPDWPTSDGSIVNPAGWLSDEHKLWEHSHRLLGWLVGMLAIVVAVTTWPRGRTLRTLGLAALAAIIVQGVLGGLRVREISTTLAMVHGIWGQVCFCLVCTVVLFTSRAWTAAARAYEARAAHVFQRGCVLGLFCTVLQLGAGAGYRHFNHSYALISHLLGAVVVILVLGWLAMWTLEQYSNQPLLRRLGVCLATLLGLQMFLGGFTFLVTVMGGDWPATVRWAAPSAHVLVGALLLAAVLALTLSAYHVLRPVGPSAEETTVPAVTTA